jgi:hypothetical protein
MVLNAISLWIIGRICEELFGAARTLAIFFAAGIVGAIVTYAASTDAMAAGASGGVMGILGAVFVELSLNRARYRAVWKSGLVGRLAIVLLAEAGFGFLFPAIDQWQHGAGLVVGAVLGVVLSPQMPSPARAVQRVKQVIATALAVAGIGLAAFAAVKVASTSLVDSLTAPPIVAWHIGGVTLDAPAAWTTNDGELTDEDVFLVVAIASYGEGSHGLRADLDAWTASEPERAKARRFDEVAPATERLVALPLPWEGSEYAVSGEDPLGDRVRYRVVVAARVLAGRVELASVYAPETIARDEPEILTNLLASAR